MDIEYFVFDGMIVETIYSCLVEKDDHENDTGISLFSLIIAFENINHALFEPGELQKTLLKLFEGGYLVFQNKKFSLVSNFMKTIWNRSNGSQYPIEYDFIIKEILAIKGYPIEYKKLEYDEKQEPLFFTIEEYNDCLDRRMEIINGLKSKIRKN